MDTTPPTTSNTGWLQNQENQYYYFANRYIWFDSINILDENIAKWVNKIFFEIAT